MKSRLTCGIVVIGLLSLSISIGLAGEMGFKVRWVKPDTQWLLRIQPTNSDGTLITERTIDPNSPALKDKKLIQVLDPVGGKPIEFEIKPFASTRKLRFIELTLPKVKDAKKVSITIDGLLLEDALGQRIAHSNAATADAPTASSADMGPTTIDTSGVKQNFLSLLAGSADGAILSGKVIGTFGKVTAFAGNDIFLRGKATADLNVKGSDARDYFNSIVGEFDAFVERNYETFFTGPGMGELGLRTKIESDQKFKTIDGTLGLAAWFSVKNGFTDFVNRVTYFSDPQRHASIAPVVALGYDYVSQFENGSGTSAPVESTGRNRLSGKLDWPLEIARGWDLRRTPLAALYDIDLIIDVTPIYDIKEGKFFVENKLSLEITPASDKNKASFVLTYANGKATPTFQNVDTILAGLKLPF
ncbi:MAG: hypothetical protein QOE26_2102 [Verrucomicrobiota bacterium]|jgi:hypothetical protein